MPARWQYWLATVGALSVALLAGYAATISMQIRTIQAEIAQRTQYVQQSVQLEGLYRELAKALADLSVRNQDAALSSLLASQGIAVNTAVAASTPPQAETKKGPKS